MGMGDRDNVSPVLSAPADCTSFDTNLRSSGWWRRFPALPCNFLIWLGLIPAFALVHEVWLGCRWNLRARALQRIQTAAAGQRGGLSPMALAERPRPWRRLVEP
jgi:hypothetical protein